MLKVIKFILISVMLLWEVSCAKYVLKARRYSGVDYYDLKKMRYTLGDVIEKNNSVKTKRCNEYCSRLTKTKSLCYTYCNDRKVEEQKTKTEYQPVSENRKKEMQSILTEALKTGIQKYINTTTNEGVVVDVAIDRNIECYEAPHDGKKTTPFIYDVKYYAQSGNIFLTMIGKRSNKQNEQLFRITVDYDMEKVGHSKFPSSVCYNEEKISRIIAQDIFPIAISAIGEDFFYYREWI